LVPQALSAAAAAMAAISFLFIMKLLAQMVLTPAIITAFARKKAARKRFYGFQAAFSL
jgi:hypothetical protein